MRGLVHAVASTTTHPKEFLRFLAVGAICYVFGILLLFALTDILKFHYLASLVVAMLIMSATGWILNRKWTFNSKDTNLMAESIRFISANMLTWLITVVLMTIAVSGLGIHYLLASAIIALAMAIVNFTIHQAWSFRRSSRACD